MYTFFIFLAVLFAAFPALAQPTYDPEKNADDQMKYWDWNRDGKVEWREYSRPATFRFSRMDANGDDIISIQEMADYRKTKTKYVKPVLKRWDENDDKEISKDEYLRSVTEEFNHLDKNSDGFLSRQELVDDWALKKKEIDDYMQKKFEDRD
ncbi:MAG: hypothetical protein ACE5DY_02815 [Mariprofundaceae bacterium]